MNQQRLLSLATGAQAVRGAVLIACALFLPCVAAAQNAPTPGQTDANDDEQTAPASARPAPAPVQPAPAAIQPGPTITIRVLDSKTGQPLRPTNLLIHINHNDEPRNDGLKLNDDFTSTAVLPLDAKVLSIEGAYDQSTLVYINCDTDTGRDGGMLKWYSIAEIVKTGIVTDNLCYKGKYQHKLKVSPVPGEFVFYVRTHNWHEGITD